MAFSLVFCEAMTRRRPLGYASSDFFGDASNLFTFYALWVKFFLTLKLSDVWQILFDKCVFPHLSVCRLVSLNAELVSLVRNWVFCLKFRPYFCLKIVFFFVWTLDLSACWQLRPVMVSKLTLYLCCRWSCSISFILLIEECGL